MNIKMFKKFLISFFLIEVLFLISSSLYAHNGNWAEGLAWIYFFLFTIIQIIVTTGYLIARKVLRKDDSIMSMIKFILIIVSLLYLLILSNHFYNFLFKLNNKGIISHQTYIFFIYFFLLNLFLIKRSKDDPQKICISWALFMIFFVLFFSWLISPRIQVFSDTNDFWDLPFGSGLWGAMNAGYFVFHPVSTPLLFGLIIWIFYSINRRFYFSMGKGLLGKNKRLLFQSLICIFISFILIGLFEPEVSGPVSKIFVWPRLKAKRGDIYNALRWSEYYGFNISRQEILNHPQYINAFMKRANQRVKNGDYEGALSDFMRIRNVFNEKEVKPYLNFNQITYNLRVSWLLSTCPSDKIRDGNKAIELVKNAIFLYGLDVIQIPVDQLVIEHRKYSEWRNNAIMSANLLQVLAAAYAETSNFVEACKLQEKALKLVLAQSNKDFENEKSILGEQLLSYMSNTPWRNLSRSIRPIFF